MRLRLLVISIVATGVVLAALPAEAARARYVVSVGVLPATADVGQPVTLTGKVRGAGSARKLVGLQRSIAGGPWTTVATTRTSRRSTYRFAVPIDTAGAQSFRVRAPRSAKRSVGYSAARSLTGWRWLNLARQPWRADNDGSAWVETGVFSLGASPGQPAADSVSLGPAPGGVARFTVPPNTACTRFRATLGWGRRSTPSTTLNASVSGLDIPVSQTVSASTLVPIDAAWTGKLVLQADSASANYPYVVFLTPRVHCSVNSLDGFAEQ